MKKIILSLILIFSINLYAKDKYKPYANFTYGDGKENVYVFINPGCGYCVQLMNKIELFEHSFTYNFYFIDMKFLEKGGRMINVILTGDKNTRFNKTLTLMKGNGFMDVERTEKMDRSLKRNKIIFDNKKLGGVPAILNDYGRKISIDNLF
jgi:thiol-disulfide isomerase/thioredoxin